MHHPSHISQDITIQCMEKKLTVNGDGLLRNTDRITRSLYL
jgi:hypothetical protein